MAIVSLDGVSYPDVAVLQLNGFTTSASNANTTLSITAPVGAPDIILDGNVFTASEVGEIEFNGFPYYVMGNRITIPAPTGGGTAYTAGTNISIDS